MRLPAIITGIFTRTSKDLVSFRQKARDIFISDYGAGGRDRYISTRFPDTIFTGQEFDVTLMSHFLFLYDEHMDYNFHSDVVAELIRITREEIRIYPLFNLRWKRSVFVDRIIGDARFSRAKFEVRKTAFEFVKGADEYLSIKL